MIVSQDVNINVSDFVTFAPTETITESPVVKTPDSVWQKMGSQFKLDHLAQSPRVKAEIRKLLAEKDKLQSILVSAAPYIYYIEKETEARHLPAELALIPIIESEFNPNDHSKRGATGLWQLMPGTARELGIKIKSKYDGRKNVIASTKAALAYFRDLGVNFKGNWLLAIAAYNCGEVRVQHATHNKGTRNFWNLSLPKETKNYVPKLLAVAEIIKNPAKYGVELPNTINEPYFKEVQIKKAVNITNVAKTTGINVKTMQALNPDCKSEPIANKGVYSILVPTSKEAIVRKILFNKLVDPKIVIAKTSRVI